MFSKKYKDIGVSEEWRDFKTFFDDEAPTFFDDSLQYSSVQKDFKFDKKKNKK